MKKLHIIWLVIAVAAFFGGWYFGKVSSPAATATTAGKFGGAGGAGATFVRNGAGGNGGSGGVGGSFVAGRVVSKDAQSLTIFLPNGNSEIVFYSTSTAVEKPATSSIGDIATGTNVIISGTQNSDGSLTAQSIQVRDSGFPAGAQ